METTKEALINRYIQAVADRETIVTRQIEGIERQLPGQKLTEDGKEELREKLTGIMGESIEEVARPCLEDVSTETLKDDTAMSLQKWKLMSHPYRYAEKRGGVFARTLTSKKGFEAACGHLPEPRDRATPEMKRSLRAAKV